MEEWCLIYSPPKAPHFSVRILNIFSFLSLSGQTCLAEPRYSAFSIRVCSSSKLTRTGRQRGVPCTLSPHLPCLIAAAASSEDVDVLFATSLPRSIEQPFVLQAPARQEKSIGSAKRVPEGHLSAMLKKGAGESEGRAAQSMVGQLRRSIGVQGAFMGGNAECVFAVVRWENRVRNRHSCRQGSSLICSKQQEPVGCLIHQQIPAMCCKSEITRSPVQHPGADRDFSGRGIYSGLFLEILLS